MSLIPLGSLVIAQFCIFNTYSSFVITGALKSIEQWVFDYLSILGTKKQFKEDLSKSYSTHIIQTSTFY